MACKGTRVSQKEKEKMWQLYMDLGSYRAVAKRMKRCEDTVAKYVREYEIATGVLNYMANR